MAETEHGPSRSFRADNYKIRVSPRNFDAIRAGCPAVATGGSPPAATCWRGTRLAYSRVMWVGTGVKRRESKTGHTNRHAKSNRKNESERGGGGGAGGLGGVGAGLRVRREGGGGREGGIGEGRQRYAEAHTRTRGDTEKKHHRYPKLLPQALEFLHDTVNKLLYLRQASALC